LAPDGDVFHDDDVEALGCPEDRGRQARWAGADHEHVASSVVGKAP